jgi:sugar/nucleoside kinase (ribokinase family)
LAIPPHIAPIVCIGEILIDLIAHPGHTLGTTDALAVREGGAPMNAAIAMARLGLPVRFSGVVGDDPFGARLRDVLTREGIDTAALRATTDLGTSLALAWRDDRGDGHFQLVRLADRLLDAGDIDRLDIVHAGGVLVGSVALAASPSRAAVHEAVRRAIVAGVPVMFDINVRPTLWSSMVALREACEPVLRAAKVLKLSLDDARHLWGAETPEQAVVEAARYDPWLVVITDGARGVHVPDAVTGTVRHLPVFEVAAVDPTGAGDAFTGALVARLVASGWAAPTDDDIRFAMAAGALATTKRGALPALPSRAELELFLAGQDQAS